MVVRVDIICDMSRKKDKRASTEPKYLRATTRAMECPFFCVGKYLETMSWELSVIRPGHNHEATRFSAHSVHRLAIMTDVQQTIEEQFKAGVQPSQIINGLYLANQDLEIKPQDIYNAKQKMKRERLGCLTPIQALLDGMEQGTDWSYNYATDEQNRITHLFCIHQESRRLLARYPMVLVMDCTYKTNKFKMPLLNIVGITGRNTTFFVCFAFLSSEKADDYNWALRQLQVVYDSLSPPHFPTVVATDAEVGLMNAVSNVFPDTQRILCQWHVNKNIQKNCRADFDTAEAYEAFFGAWLRCVGSSTQQEYRDNWEALKNEYNFTHYDSRSYTIYIMCTYNC